MAESYHLQSLRVVFVSKLRPNLTNTISNLQKSLPNVEFPKSSSNSSGTDDFLYVYPQRLQRRAWRVCYLTSPFKYLRETMMMMMMLYLIKLLLLLSLYDKNINIQNFKLIGTSKHRSISFFMIGVTSLLLRICHCRAQLHSKSSQLA